MAKEKHENREKNEKDTAQNGQEVQETVEAPAAEEEKAAPVDDMKDKFLRLAADFDNFKKRSRAEKDALYGLAVADTVEKFLPVIDDLERALAAANDESPLKKGVEQILSKASAVMSGMGVTEIGKKGEKFDVAMHEAVMQCQSDEFEGGCVAEVFQKGYKLGDKVIRYAKVKVTE